MAQISKTAIDADLRSRIFADILDVTSVDGVEATAVWSDMSEYRKVNDRQWGCILTDANGVERYCRIGVIVAEEREDMTARELMDAEIAAYNAAQQKKAEKKAAALAKKAEREKAKKEKEKEKDAE